MSDEIKSEKRLCTACGQWKEAKDFPYYTGRKCRECYNAGVRKNRTKKMVGEEGLNPELEKFTPRQLIAELRARGYRGVLTFQQEVKV